MSDDLKRGIGRMLEDVEYYFKGEVVDVIPFGDGRLRVYATSGVVGKPPVFVTPDQVEIVVARPTRPNPQEQDKEV